MKLNSTIFFLTIALLLISFSCKKAPIEIPFSKGTYDIELAQQKLIMVVEEEETDTISGFYIYNKANAVEPKHPFKLSKNKSYLLFESDSINGKVKRKNPPKPMHARFIVSGKNASFFFWKNRREMSYKKRQTYQAEISSRYNKKQFSKLKTDYDLVYGNAKGYWTDTPYLDDPYIYILGRGVINFWKGEKDLELKLDLYRPEGDSLKLRPLVLLVHGGAFYIGNKQSETEIILAQRFAQLGYVAASMNYRMGFRLKGYDVERTGYKSIQDVHAALRYLAHNAEKYGIDPSHVYVAGTSAGAIASLTIAYLDNNERPESTFASRFLYDLGNIETSGNKYNEEFTIKAVGNMWGAVNDTAIINAGQNVPVISFHGTNDDIVPIDHDFPFRFMMRFNRLVMNKMYGSRPVHEQLNRLKIDNELHVFENEGHEPQLDNFKRVNDKLDFIAGKMESFFYKYTAPQIKTFKSNITVNKLSPIEAIYYEVNNGEVSLIEVSGGIPASNNKTENRIIWFSDTEKGKFTIHTKNRFGATTQKAIVVTIEQID